MVSPQAKIETLGLYNFTPRMKKFVEAVSAGMGVTRDIGDSDPERAAPPKVAEYLEARRKDWEAAGITMKIESVNENKDKYPFTYVVSRATLRKAVYGLL